MADLLFVLGATQRSQSATADATEEVQRYLSEPDLSTGEDPFSYWAARATVCPYLCRMAKRYLQMPINISAMRAGLLQSWRGSERQEEQIKAKG